MGRDCQLLLKATIDKKSGKRLASFCRDWAFIEPLVESPSDSDWSEIYDGCQNLFFRICDEQGIRQLESGILHLEFEGKFDDEGFRILTETLLPIALVKLETFFYVIPEFDSRVDYTFDEKKRVLIPTETRLAAASEENDVDYLRDDEEPEVEFVPPKIWRDRLRQFLKLISDLDRQERILVEKRETDDFDPPFTEFDIWFDVHTYYMDRLNFEQGLESLAESGFLTKKEQKLFAPFDTLFQKYLPEELLTPDASTILEDRKWRAVAELAKELLHNGFLKS